MASISQIKLPNNSVYDIKAKYDISGNIISDTYLRKDFDSIGHNVSFNSSVDIDDLTAGTLLVTGAARFTNSLIGNLKGTASNVPWSGVTSKPTTLSGYGITDALSSSTKYALSDSVGGNALRAVQDGNGNNISSTYLPLSGGTMTGTLNILGGDRTSYSEGIRMHVSSLGWTAMVLCGSDNTGNTGTSAKTWGVYNKDGLFYISKNSASSGTAQLSCVNDNVWRVNGNILLHAGNYSSYAPKKDGTGASGTWGIDITGNAKTATSADSATKATHDGAGNVITSKYVTTDTTQTISGAKTFSKETTISSATASTNKTTGALKVKGGIASEGQMSADKVMIGDKCTLEYDANLQCLNFVFA